MFEENFRKLAVAFFIVGAVLFGSFILATKAIDIKEYEYETGNLRRIR